MYRRSDSLVRCQREQYEGKKNWLTIAAKTPFSHNDSDSPMQSNKAVFCMQENLGNKEGARDCDNAVICQFGLFSDQFPLMYLRDGHFNLNLHTDTHVVSSHHIWISHLWKSYVKWSLMYFNWFDLCLWNLKYFWRPLTNISQRNGGSISIYLW